MVSVLGLASGFHALTFIICLKWRSAKQVITWLAVALLSVLIVASRKHYSVDVLIAWYVVPLVFWTLHQRWTTKRNTVEGTGAGDYVYNSDIESAGDLQVGAVAIENCTWEWSPGGSDHSNHVLSLEPVCLFDFKLHIHLARDEVRS